MTGLQKLFLQKHATHPALRELILEGPWSTRTDYWGDLIELLPAAQAANVVFVTKNNRFPGKNDGFHIGISGGDGAWMRNSTE